MTQPVAGTQRVVTAIRKADQLARNEKGSLPQSSGARSRASSGKTKWAKITALQGSDANNYTVSIWSNRSSYVDGDTALETGKECRVPDIVDQLSVNDSFGVEASSLTGEDYICIQQLGVMG